jgi:hypothetical protein
MRMALQRWLDSPRSVVWASLTTLAIGLFFVFVWAPHPWSWRGIDQYDELARALARGEPFGTTDVPWGYAYFISIFYFLFPTLAWAPVTAQVFINALTPLLIYRLASPAVGRRTAAIAAWITAIFSFNTIYASTQTSDSICTVLFLLSVLCFVRAHQTSSTAWFLLTGVLAGLTPQFRPNMILLPLLIIGGYAFYPPRSRRRLLHCAVFMAGMVAMLLPWTIRNYRYTGTIQPTSTHSGIQLWYGTLQVGPYLESRAHNPRWIFASAPFDYTSLEAPIIVSADRPCPDPAPPRLAYRTDRDPQLRWVDGRPVSGVRWAFEIPAIAAPATVYYFIESAGRTFPPGGNDEPLIYFVSHDHLGDLDSRHELLDFFDLVRLMRHLAWGDALPAPLDLNGDGATTAADLDAAVTILIPETPHLFAAFEFDDRRAVLRLTEGSSLTVPRDFRGRQTDVEAAGGFADALVSRHANLAILEAGTLQSRTPCQAANDVRVNDVFYRREPHEMRRYTALAFDNISRDPLAFAKASAYRMVRLFIVRPGTDDRMTTFQYRGSQLIFTAGLILSATYLALFVAGVLLAWRARSPFLYALIPIVYVPLTICFVLTNMRYTITVQPLMFVFVAITVAAGLRLFGWGWEETADQPCRDHAGGDDRRLDHDDLPRHRGAAVVGEQEDVRDEDAKRQGLDHLGDVLLDERTPQPPVQSAGEKRHELRRHDDGQRLVEHVGVAQVRFGIAEHQLRSQVVGRADNRDVDQHFDDAAAIHEVRVQERHAVTDLAWRWRLVDTNAREVDREGTHPSRYRLNTRM